MSIKSLHPSPQLVFEEQQGVVVAPSHKQIISLYKKSENSGIPFDTIFEVFKRGFAVSESEQEAFNRVNSFIAGGKAMYMDNDLIEKRGLWDNIHAKRERIKHGSGEHMRKPGSKGAPTPEQLKSAKSEEYNFEIDETTSDGLAAKASKSGISISTLRKVYHRGIAAWNSGHRPGTTPQQWGMARVNSYIGKGSGTYGGADKDLHEDWSQKYKKSINCAHPKGFSQKAHCAGKNKQNESVEYEMLCPDCGISEGDTSNLPRVAKDKESGLPKKYVAGLSKSTAKARAAHWKKMDKKSDSDPSAYEPAPGDATAKTKPSKHTLKYHAMYGENMDEEILEACWVGYKQVGVKKKGDKMVPNCVPEAVNPAQQAAIAIYNKKHNIKPKNEEYTGGEPVSKNAEDPSSRFTGTTQLTDTYKSMTPGQKTINTIKKAIKERAELYECDGNCTCGQHDVDEDWSSSKYKNPSGGLTKAGVDRYNRDNPGHHLKTAVTTKPSKLKKGSKAANRRKSFCARMGGMKKRLTSAKTAHDPDSRINKALRKWHC